MAHCSATLAGGRYFCRVGVGIISTMTDPATVASAPQIVTVDASHDGQRLDNFLLRVLKGIPKTHVYRIVRTGQVRVNKGRIRPDYRLRSGDQVRIPPLRQAQASTPATAPEATCRAVAAAVLYEDGQLLVLDKPAGLAVHSGSGLTYGLIEALRQMRPSAPFLELVHRLDRETSGCLLVAKSRPSLLALQQQLGGSEMTKAYLALVAGQWQGGARTIDAPLQKNVLRGGERMVQVDAGGRAARTHFRPVAVYQQSSLMEIRLETGRTHQIRVHAAHIGCPLAGDSKYGMTEFNREMKDNGLRRLFLHAHHLAFRHPASQQELHISAPLGTDLQHVLDQLEA